MHISKFKSIYKYSFASIYNNKILLIFPIQINLQMTWYKNDEIQNGVDKEKLPPLWLYLANISPSLCYIYNTFTPSTTYGWGHHPLCRVHHTKQNCDQRLQKIKTIFIIPRIFHLFSLMHTDFQGANSYQFRMKICNFSYLKLVFYPYLFHTF